jgi:hypothetical protein
MKVQESINARDFFLMKFENGNHKPLCDVYEFVSMFQCLCQCFNVCANVSMFVQTVLAIQLAIQGKITKFV